MNHFKASQRQGDMRWDYTCTNDGRTFAVGYCVPWEKIEKAHTAFPGGPPLDDTHKDKHHEDGHATSEEACACYRQYLLDRMFATTTRDTYRPCKVCEELTNHRVRVDHQHFVLCPEHATQEEVDKLMPPVHEIFST